VLSKLPEDLEREYLQHDFRSAAEPAFPCCCCTLGAASCGCESIGVRYAGLQPTQDTASDQPLILACCQTLSYAAPLTRHAMCVTPGSTVAPMWLTTCAAPHCCFDCDQLSCYAGGGGQQTPCAAGWFVMQCSSELHCTQ
jgi:hypothetical protein